MLNSKIKNALKAAFVCFTFLLATLNCCFTCSASLSVDEDTSLHTEKYPFVNAPLSADRKHRLYNFYDMEFDPQTKETNHLFLKLPIEKDPSEATQQDIISKEAYYLELEQTKKPYHMDENIEPVIHDEQLADTENADIYIGSDSQQEQESTDSLPGEDDLLEQPQINEAYNNIVIIHGDLCPFFCNIC